VRHWQFRPVSVVKHLTPLFEYRNQQIRNETKAGIQLDQQGSAMMTPGSAVVSDPPPVSPPFVENHLKIHSREAISPGWI
jgi:hypothetical protein